MSAFNDRRRGYTLLELVAALGTSAILVGGLTSTLIIASQALTPDVTATAENNRSSLALVQIASDLRLALSLTERTAHAVTMTVPDRNSDGLADTIRYSWAGAAGDPLLYQYNGGAAVTLADDVQEFNVAALTRLIEASACVVPGTVVFHPPVQKDDTADTSLTIDRPEGLVPGNLMVAAVAVDGDVANTLVAPPGWTLVNNVVADANGQVTLGVWWRVAAAAEESDSFEFNWESDEKVAYGWIMCFSGVETAAPINDSSSTEGMGASPACPSVTTTVANAMIVRIGAFDYFGLEPTLDVGHTSITAGESGATDPAVSGAAGCKTQATAGASNEEVFTLTSPQEYVTVTLAIAPDDGL